MSKIPPKINDQAKSQAKGLGIASAKGKVSDALPEPTFEEKKQSAAFKKALNRKKSFTPTREKTPERSSAPKYNSSLERPQGSQPRGGEPQRSEPPNDKLQGNTPQRDLSQIEKSKNNKDEVQHFSSAKKSKNLDRTTSKNESTPPRADPRLRAHANPPSRAQSRSRSLPNEANAKPSSSSVKPATEASPNLTSPRNKKEKRKALPIDAPPVRESNLAMPVSSSPVSTSAKLSQKISPVKTNEMVQIIEKASARVLLAHNKADDGVQLRLDLNPALLPDTTLSVKKTPDGGLAMTFTSDNPESHALLQNMQQGLQLHLSRTQNTPMLIQGMQSNGQSFLSTASGTANGTANGTASGTASGQSQAGRQNASDQQNKKLDWDNVKDQLEEDK